MTASLPVFGKTGQLRGVLGLDIELENLSRFLGSLSVGQSGRAFSELASKAALFDPDDVESLRELTEIVSATLSVRRASAWGLYDDGILLKCEDIYDRETNGHTQGTVLKFDDFPELQMV